jgi:hypothetical protein
MNVKEILVDLTLFNSLINRAIYNQCEIVLFDESKPEKFEVEIADLAKRHADTVTVYKSLDGKTMFASDLYFNPYNVKVIASVKGIADQIKDHIEDVDLTNENGNVLYITRVKIDSDYPTEVYVKFSVYPTKEDWDSDENEEKFEKYLENFPAYLESQKYDVSPIPRLESLLKKLEEEVEAQEGLENSEEYGNAKGILKVLDENSDGIQRIYTDYSGRGMYGAKCFGVIVDRYSYNDLMEKFEEMGVGGSSDNMGLDMIIYWPRYKYEQVKAEDEDNVLRQFDKDEDDDDDGATANTPSIRKIELYTDLSNEFEAEADKTCSSEYALKPLISELESKGYTVLDEGSHEDITLYVANSREEFADDIFLALIFGNEELVDIVNSNFKEKYAGKYAEVEEIAKKHEKKDEAEADITIAVENPQSDRIYPHCWVTIEQEGIENSLPAIQSSQFIESAKEGFRPGEVEANVIITEHRHMYHAAQARKDFAALFKRELGLRKQPKMSFRQGRSSSGLRTNLPEEEKIVSILSESGIKPESIQVFTNSMTVWVDINGDHTAIDIKTPKMSTLLQDFKDGYAKKLAEKKEKAKKLLEDKGETEAVRMESLASAITYKIVKQPLEVSETSFTQQVVYEALEMSNDGQATVEEIKKHIDNQELWGYYQKSNPGTVRRARENPELVEDGLKELLKDGYVVPSDGKSEAAGSFKFKATIPIANDDEDFDCDEFIAEEELRSILGVKLKDVKLKFVKNLGAMDEANDYFQFEVSGPAKLADKAKIALEEFIDDSATALHPEQKGGQEIKLRKIAEKYIAEVAKHANTGIVQHAILDPEASDLNKEQIASIKKALVEVGNRNMGNDRIRKEGKEGVIAGSDIAEWASWITSDCMALTADYLMENIGSRNAKDTYAFAKSKLEDCLMDFYRSEMNKSNYPEVYAFWEDLIYGKKAFGASEGDDFFTVYLMKEKTPEELQAMCKSVEDSFETECAIVDDSAFNVYKLGKLKGNEMAQNDVATLIGQSEVLEIA